MKKLILASFICCISMQILTFAVPDIKAGSIPQADAINNHDLEILKNQERERQVQKDFENYEKQKKEEKSKPNEEKIKEKVEKAKPEDYATSGVYIENIEVSPSQILSEQEIKEITDQYTQRNLTFENLQELINQINKLYLKKGYVTARSYLPEQTIENETVKIELMEGKVGDLTVKGNKWTRSNYIEKRLNLNEGDLFNIQQLEEDLMLFNRYNDGVELNSTLFPGKRKTGTTDVDVQATEKLPFHVTVLYDNAGRTTTGKNRFGLMLQDDSLFGLRDKLTLGGYLNEYSFTPFLDYNIPVTKKDDRVGVSFSSSKAKIGHGDFSIFNIESRSQNYSLYYTRPLYRKLWTELTSTSSIAYKKSQTSFDGEDLLKSEVTTLQTGVNFRYDTKRGIWYLNQNIGYSIPKQDDYSNYFKLDGGFLRLHAFGHDLTGTFKGNYQIIPQKIVPSLDHMAAGGISTVRGYSEGLLSGKDGYIFNAELLFPVAPKTIKNKKKAKEVPFIGSFCKGFAFIDHAGILPYKGEGESYDKNDFLMSIGLGLKADLPKDINLKMSYGLPVTENKYEENKSGKFHIELRISPDFDSLLKLRKAKAKN